MARALIWLQAARLPSLIYIFFPLALGCYFYGWSSISWQVIYLLAGYGWGLQLFIVFANDYADARADALNPHATIFSGGSRVLVEGKVTPYILRQAAFAAAIFAFSCLVVLSLWAGQLETLFVGCLGFVMLWAYSFAPFKLSYRGGGEFLQALGLGFVLPLLGWLSGGGMWELFPLSSLSVMLPVQLACAFATTLPDRIGDTRAQKNTIATTIGSRGTVFIIALLHICSAVSLYYVRYIPLSYICMVLVPCCLYLCLEMMRNPQPGSKLLSVVVFLQILQSLAILGMLLQFWW